MAPTTTTSFVSKTQHYLKVKKPLLERQRRARINKCLDALKTLVAEFQHDDAILRMDKAEMLETAIDFIRSISEKSTTTAQASMAAQPTTADGFRNGYMNAVNEVSRVMAGMPGMSVEIGKSVMTHLGFEFNRMLRFEASAAAATAAAAMQPLHVQTTTMDSKASPKAAPLSPASSGYHSDSDENSMASPSLDVKQQKSMLWRPW